MLTRRLKGMFAALAAAVIFAFVASSLPAFAEASCDENDGLIGECSIEVPVPGSPGGSSGAKPGERVCLYSGSVVPCRTDFGTWVDSLSAYCKVKSPQPPKSDAAWQGNTTGAVFQCRLKGGTSWGADFVTWFPSSEPVDAAELARKAVARLEVGAVRIGMNPIPTSRNPKVMAVVGQKIWMWADSPDASTWGPKSVVVKDGPYSVSLSAKVEKVVWDMGNGKAVTCRVPGTKWEKWRLNLSGNPASPDCGYMYEKQGTYTVSATSHWNVGWSALGQTGTISLTLTDKVELLVGEIQVVNVPTRKR